MTAVVELIAAKKTYGQVDALRGVNIAIQAGEVVAMLGPNGAGKTTSISLMLGLRQPTSGQARLFGLDPRDARARSRCGVMLQESGVPELLKVREILEIFSSYYPHPLPVATAIGLAGLGEKANARIDHLSGGQRQRLYYALAVVGDPEVLFLDEPTAGMDVEGRRGFLDGLRESVKGGKTIVLTTHYLEEADEIAQRVIVIDRGQLVADAPPAEIKRRVAGKTMRFAARADERTFAGLPVQHVEIADGRVRLLTNEPETVLKALFASGLELSDLEVTGADLEDAFLALTSRAEDRRVG
ncbi:MAG TPA: ABC transporter ATP-binding protein [Candidatus Limnocylindria bacterium]